LDEEVWNNIEPFCFPPNNKEHLNLRNQPPPPKKKEKTKMPTAYILVNTEIGAEKEVLKALKKVEGIEEVHNLWGVYDLIANVQAESMEELRYIITQQIEKIGKINSKLTMIITEKPQNKLQEQVLFESPLIQ
jgi:DNA-binding Lrp family transcriptional regulator